MDTPSPDTPTVALDANDETRNDIFGALSHGRRRFVLQHLRTSEAPVSVDDLVTELAAWDDGPPAADRRERIEVSLRHVHLPKLADFGLIEYDEPGRRAALADDSDELRSVLSAVADHEQQ